LIVSKIIKIAATSCQILRLKCIKSASQDMALQTIVSRPHHLICPSQTVYLRFYTQNFIHHKHGSS